MKTEQADKKLSIKTAVIIPVYNEEAVISDVLISIPGNEIDHIIVVNDGSTDSTPEILATFGDRITIINHDRKCYIGTSIRDGLKQAVDMGIDVVVIMSGNGKDDPAQISRLLQPIREDKADFVQGSRYLKGGDFNKMPLHRCIVTRVYPVLLRMLTGFRATDGTNGFRAYKLSILDDPDIDIEQDWLDECFEYYLSLRILQRKYRTVEVPVSKYYPQTRKYNQYTKVRPGPGWLNRLKPLVYCGMFGKK